MPAPFRGVELVYVCCFRPARRTEKHTGTAGALIGNFLAIRDIIALASEDILVNDLDVATRLGQANTGTNASLAEYESLFGG